MDGKESVLGTKIAGAELGAMLGWMSTRVLGQYDLLVIEDESPEDQDIVYYVAPNVLMLEQRYAFPPQEFRLWLALHEVTHRAQFTGVPWMREHFLGLVNSTMDSVDPDPKRFLAAAQRLLEHARLVVGPVQDGEVLERRALAVGAQLLDARDGPLGLVLLAVRLEHLRHPVSYTHLTLPTKRIV